MGNINARMSHDKPLRGNDMRQRNERLVLNMIYSASGISQSEIASITGLKPPTVYRIFSDFESNGIIEECGEEKAPFDRMGRRPSYYRVSPGAYFAVGIDFWSVSASIVVVDFAGTVVHENITAFPRNVDGEEVMGRLENLIRNAMRTAHIREERILGIGVGAPGMVDIVHGRVVRYSRIRSVSDLPIAERLQRAFNMPVYVNNNCSVIALSEYRYRKLADRRSVFAFLVRSGVGGAFVQDGVAFVNDNLTALEVGHMSVDPRGPACKCGGVGCLEGYLNEEKVLASLKESTNCRSWQELDTCLSENDERVIEVLRRYAVLLTRAATNIANLFNPDAFLVVARNRGFAEFLAAEMNASFKQSDHLFRMNDTIAVGRKYDPFIACKGAADLVLAHFFEGTI